MNIISTKYMDLSKKNIVVEYTNDIGENEFYSFNLNSEYEPDEYSGLRLEVESKIEKGEIIPTFSDDATNITSMFIRASRDSLLEETDQYFTVSDRPIKGNINLEKLREYRQALRDIPQQEGFPNDVVWPDKPSI